MARKVCAEEGLRGYSVIQRGRFLGMKFSAIIFHLRNHVRIHRVMTTAEIRRENVMIELLQGIS